MNKKRLGLKLRFERFFDMENAAGRAAGPLGSPPLASWLPPTRLASPPLGPQRAAAALGASKQHSVVNYRQDLSSRPCSSGLARKLLVAENGPAAYRLLATCTLVLAACAAAVLTHSFFVFACLCCCPAPVLRRGVVLAAPQASGCAEACPAPPWLRPHWQAPPMLQPWSNASFPLV